LYETIRTHPPKDLRTKGNGKPAYPKFSEKKGAIAS